MPRAWFWTTAGALFLTLLAVTPVSAAPLTWIGVGGPPDWAPVPGYSLEIGATHVYTVDQVNGGGVVSLQLRAPAIVRVRRLSDCTPVVRFVAQPGDHFYIRFDRAGRPRVENWNGAGMDSGPALGPAADPNCAPLPDTAAGPPGSPTAPDPHGALWAWISTLAAGFGAVCAAAATWRRVPPHVRSRGSQG
jgi:hypothetical protein